jgi:hypothetical protein
MCTRNRRKIFPTNKEACRKKNTKCRNKKEFNLQVRNRFQKLGELENEEVEHRWLKVKYVFVKTAEEVLGFKKATGKD